MGGRYDDEICHDNKVPLPPNSTAGKENELPEDLEEDDDGEIRASDQKKWINEDNPYLWEGELDADDYADWNNGD